MGKSETSGKYKGPISIALTRDTCQGKIEAMNEFNVVPQLNFMISNQRKNSINSNVTVTVILCTSILFVRELTLKLTVQWLTVQWPNHLPLGNTARLGIINILKLHNQEQI